MNFNSVNSSCHINSNSISASCGEYSKHFKFRLMNWKGANSLILKFVQSQSLWLHPQHDFCSQISILCSESDSNLNSMVTEIIKCLLNISTDHILCMESLLFYIDTIVMKLLALVTVAAVSIISLLNTSRAYYPPPGLHYTIISSEAYRLIVTKPILLNSWKYNSLECTDRWGMNWISIHIKTWHTSSPCAFNIDKPCQSISVTSSYLTLKGQFTKKWKFCHNLLTLELFKTYEFLSSVKHKRRCFEECW